MCWSQNQINNLFLASITIIFEQAKNLNNKNKNLKAKIYHFIIATILKNM